LRPFRWVEERCLLTRQSFRRVRTDMSTTDSPDYYLELAAEAEERAAQVTDAECRRNLYTLAASYVAIARALQELQRLNGQGPAALDPAPAPPLIW